VSQLVKASQVAAMAGISKQAMLKAIKGSKEGRPWRGSILQVQSVRSKGGNSGSANAIFLKSLPTEFQEQFLSHQTTLKPASKTRKDGKSILWGVVLGELSALSGQVLQQAIDALVAKPPLRENGKPLFTSESTIRRRLALYKNEGSRALLRKVRNDSGTKRVLVTKQFDTAARRRGIENDLLEDEGARLDKLVKSMIGDGVTRALIEEFAGDHLSNRAVALGISNGGERFTVPLHYIQNRRMWRKLATLLKNAKGHQDSNPYSPRHIRGMRPMQMVVADVHPIDVVLTRADGSQANPKMITWFDIGTQRVFATVHLLDPGKGTTNAMVIESFRALVFEWGMPETLYTDNGSEYNFAGFLVDALQLVSSDGRVIKALPYAAQSKPIEPWFGKFERKYLKTLPGWIGGDRLNKVTANVGKKVVPYSLGIEAFSNQVQNFIQHYNGTGLKKYGDKSPNDLYQAALDADWTLTAINEIAFDMAFSIEVTRDVNNCLIDVNGEKWKVPDDYPDFKVTVLVPKYQSWKRLPLKDSDGNFVGYAERPKEFSYNDLEGARASAKSKSAYTKTVRALGEGLPKINVVALINNKVARMPPPPVARIGARLGPSDSAAEMAEGLRESAQEKADREARHHDAEAEAQAAYNERLLAKMKRSTGE
jgi:hypothetical protein